MVLPCAVVSLSGLLVDLEVVRLGLASVLGSVLMVVVAGAGQSMYCGDPTHLNTFPDVTGAALLLHAAVSLC